GTEQPVERRRLVLDVRRVAGHASIKRGLGGERREQVVRAPNERNADAEPVAGSTGHGLEAAAVVPGHEATGAVRPRAPDLVVAVVVPGVPLVMPRRVLSHPRAHGREGGGL